MFNNRERPSGDAIASSRTDLVRDGGSGYLLDILDLIGEPAIILR